MPVRLYGHLTWTTLQRQPIINAGVAEFLHRFLPHEARRHGALVLGIGIVADHVHVVLRLPPVVDVPRLVQGFKGASARLANRDGLMPRAPLRWTEGTIFEALGCGSCVPCSTTFGTRRRVTPRWLWARVLKDARLPSGDFSPS